MMSETAVPEMAVSDFVFVGDNRFLRFVFFLYISTFSTAKLIFSDLLM